MMADNHTDCAAELTGTRSWAVCLNIGSGTGRVFQYNRDRAVFCIFSLICSVLSPSFEGGIVANLVQPMFFTD